MPDETEAESSETGAAPFDLVLPYRYAPRPPSGFTVVRKELLRHLTEASLLKQLSIVRGPAGSGKTTLLAQWRSVGLEMNRPIAWLTVDRADRDPAHFVAGLAAALEEAGCGPIAEGFRAMLGDLPRRSTLQIAQMLASIANRSGEAAVIVLDQYEEMDGAAAGEIISGFLQYAVTIRLVIASRIRPMIPLGSLRARDQLFEIGPSDLNLTPMETRAIFDDDVPELYTRRLHLETSGEAVAVGFARRVIDELPRDMIGAENWHDQLHEYYRAEVLDTLPPELRAAMSRLVVVERFDLSLASALVGRSAADMIERLHHVDGLLLRHRGTQEFYFSEMLRRFLERRLAWLDDEERVALHRRAAGWFAERGRDSEALRHAVAAGDRERAVMLLDRIGYARIVTRAGVQAAHHLFDSIGFKPEGMSTGTLLSLALIHAHEGDVDKAASRLAEAKQRIAVDGAGDPALDGQRILAEAFVAGFRDETMDAATGPALEHYIATAPENEHDGRAQARILMSWDRFCQGDVEGAEALADAAASEYAETEGVYGCVFMHVHRTLARFWRNDLDRALEEVTLAERITRIFFPEDQRLRAMSGSLRAGLLHELGRPDPLTDITALVGAVAAVESWSEVQIWVHLMGARAALAEGRGGEARGIVDYGLEVARRLDVPRMAWNMRLAAVDIAIRLGDGDRAAHEAAALLLPEAAFLEGEGARLTWQERIAGVLTAIRLHDERGEAETAVRLIDLARNLIVQTSAHRFATILAICEARHHHYLGDIAAAQACMDAAADLRIGSLPVRLFLDAGEWVRGYLPDFAALPVPSLRDVPLAEAARALSRDPLTSRERQILLFMGEGHPNKVAAHRLGLSEATVKFHLRNIYRKLHAQNRTQALARYRTFADIR
ncbi:LuxR C-terminal-related transcriptional regulator [Flavisphingomonas formosensis]|uniref:LuxR C-terminal-related transcriptional regulator n=1 Tax=Flavisphingomonas formosensis TaxID=861534 RepID=UPI0012FACAED|nr:LuxR C-terminal-related transcriptional regulator [Sphingomonas formosensis]